MNEITSTEEVEECVDDLAEAIAEDLAGRTIGGGTCPECGECDTQLGFIKLVDDEENFGVNLVSDCIACGRSNEGFVSF